MKKFTKVCLMIAAVAAGIGILCCGIASLMGLRYNTIRQMAYAGKFTIGNWSSEEDADTGDWISEDTSAKNSFPTNQVKHFRMDIDAAEIVIEEGADTANIVVMLNRGYEKYYSAGMEGDTLYVNYKCEDHIYNIGRSPKITVQIPDGMAFGDVELDIAAADADFDVEDAACENLTINVGAGKLDADGFKVSGKTEVEIGAGSVDLGGGSYKDVKLDCGMGHLALEGKLTGDLTASCSMGTIDLDIEADETDYNYELSCSMGELRVNGTSYSGMDASRTVGNADAVGTIRIDCSMGTVNVEVKK